MLFRKTSFLLSTEEKRLIDDFANDLGPVVERQRDNFDNMFSDRICSEYLHELYTPLSLDQSRFKNANKILLVSFSSQYDSITLK